MTGDPAGEWRVPPMRSTDCSLHTLSDVRCWLRERAHAYLEELGPLNRGHASAIESVAAELRLCVPFTVFVVFDASAADVLYGSFGLVAESGTLRVTGGRGGDDQAR